MATKNISITPELLTHAEERVASGDFDNMSEYMRSLVRQDKQQRDRDRELLELVRQGLASGDPVPMTGEDRAEIRSAARAELANRRKISA